MKGSIIAANRNLGVVVVQTPDDGCVVIASPSILSLKVGDEIEGNMGNVGEALVMNVTTGEQVTVHIQETGVPRGEAVGTMAVI